MLDTVPDMQAGQTDPNAQATFTRLLPELANALDEWKTQDLEVPDGAALALFKTFAGPRLLVPRELGGLGASALEAVQVQRALAMRSPSLAVGTTMHHFSVASLREALRAGNGTQALLLEVVSDQNLLMASAFAESAPGGSIVHPNVSLRRSGDDLLLSGVKKPCSLSRSMDLITVSALDVDQSGRETLVVAAIDSRARGVDTQPFWASRVLAAAESHSVIFDDVRVSENQLVRVGTPGAAATDAVQRAGFAWFTVLMMASYIGMAGAIVADAVAAQHHSSYRRVRLLGRYWSAVRNVEAIAQSIDKVDAPPSDRVVAEILTLRVELEVELQLLAGEAASILGGRALASGGASLNIHHPAVQCLAFHPPRSCDITDAITATILAGAPLQIR